MLPLIEWQFVTQSIDQSGTVLIQEVNKPDLPLLWLSARERLRLRMPELTAQRLVFPLRRLNDLALKFLEVVLHAAEGRSRRGLERRVHLRYRHGQRVHPLDQGPAGLVQGMLHGGRH